MPQLRPYQQRAIAGLRQSYASGHRAPCLVLPTGAGKTVVAAEIIRLTLERGGRVLFLAHRVELIGQTVAKLENAGVTKVRIIQASSDLGDRRAPVVVASIPTLTRRKDLPDASLVIFDECHHTVAKTWKTIADHYSGALLLGLTATPERSDGAALGDIFDDLVVGATVKELIDLGHLAQCRVQGPPVVLDSNTVAMSVADAYAKYADGQRCVVFCSTVEESQRIAESLPSAAVVSGTMSSAERKRVLADRSIRVLVNVFVLTEGWDDPTCAVCILNRNPGHAGVYLQMCGRVLRPHPSKAEALIIDLCGSTLEHGSPVMDREFSLDGTAIDHDRKLVKQCAVCGAVFEGPAKECPVCGCQLGGGDSNPIVKDVLGIELADISHVPRPMPTITIVSKYPGVCRLCNGMIHIGDRIRWAKGEKPRHAACPMDVDAANALMRGAV